MESSIRKFQAIPSRLSKTTFSFFLEYIPSFGDLAPLHYEMIILKRVLLWLQQTKCPPRSPMSLPHFPSLQRWNPFSSLSSLFLLLKFVPVIFAPSPTQDFSWPFHSSKSPFLGQSPVDLAPVWPLAFLFSLPRDRAKKRGPPHVLRTISRSPSSRLINPPPLSFQPITIPPRPQHTHTQPVSH